MTGGRFHWVDWLRVVALALVVLRHAIQVTGAPMTRDVVMLDQGQLGVALFCALAGFFAVGGDRALGRWAIDRVVRLFPAYWAVTAAVFAGNALIGYKPASVGLFVAQMLGIGYFTHGGEHLINVPSWFLSLILACYALAAVVRVSRRRLPVIGVLAATAVALTLVDYRTDFTRQILAFLLGMAVREIGLLDARPYVRLALVAALVPMAWLEPDLGYAAWAMAAIVSVSSFRLPAWPPVRVIADYSYEVFLVHGPALVLLARLTGWPPAPALVAALVVTAAAAAVLKRATDRVMAGVPQRHRAAPMPSLAPSSRQGAA